VCLDETRRQVDRPAQVIHRLVAAPLVLPNDGLGVVVGGLVGAFRQRGRDARGGELEFAARVGDQAEPIKRLGILRLGRQHLLPDQRRGVEVSRALSLGGRAPPGVDIAVRDRHPPVRAQPAASWA